ncbi:hypothetical protein D9758_002681 [Tetrapyrgos nigripes]|uniref:Translin n=1 Tax=Tetrapyrgos nigripes TaxID=182062 RepID=A0A8H5GRR9_9AGAR|nr:hypothetical protein D9758_002681 [Tetrapyrgos nigripes]
MDPQDLEKLNDMLDNESELREVNTPIKNRFSLPGSLSPSVWSKFKVRDKINDLDKKTRTMVGTLNKIHSTRLESIPTLVDSVRPILTSCGETFAGLAELIPPNQFWRWKEMWCNSLRTAVFAAVLIKYLTNGTLLSLKTTNEILGIKEEWKDRVALSAEDYLHGLISLVNELSRYAINVVTLGSFDEPLKISAFVKDLFAGFSMLNLKNDSLRRRFDSLKYDMKKIEEVVYDVSLRKLVSSGASEKTLSEK